MNRLTVLASLFATAIVLGIATPAAAAGPYQFYSVNPCRVLDTRDPNGPTAGQPLAASAWNALSITGHCSIPPNATSAVLNIAVLSPAAAGFLVAWQYNQSQPATSNINYDAGEPALANGMTVPLDANPNFSIYVASTATTHIVIDVTGYYQ